MKPSLFMKGRLCSLSGRTWVYKKLFDNQGGGVLWNGERGKAGRNVWVVNQDPADGSSRWWHLLLSSYCSCGSWLSSRSAGQKTTSVLSLTLIVLVTDPVVNRPVCTVIVNPCWSLGLNPRPQYEGFLLPYV